MKLVLRLLLLAVVVAVGFWIWTTFFPSPKTAIERRLNKLARLASFSEKDGMIVRLANGQKIAGYFTKEAEVKLDVPGVEKHTFNGRDELMEAVQAARASLRSVQAQFYGMNVELAPSKQEAFVDLILKADVNGEVNSVVQEMKFFMKKVDGDWLVSGLETVQTLK